jgi:hypothetical protein
MMPETKRVTYKNAAATLTIQDDDSWTLRGNTVNLDGKNAIGLMKLVEDGDLSMAPYVRDPNASAPAAGRRRKTRRRRHQRKTRRSRK